MISPILFYGLRYGELKKIKEIEMVQHKFCKYVLNVGSQTPNCAVMADCGRLPLYVHYVNKCVQYWLKIIHMNDNRYPKMYIHCYLILIQTVGELGLLILELYCIDMVLVGWLCLTSHRQRGHLETAPSFTVPCEGREARYIHRSDRDLNPGPSHSSPLRYRKLHCGFGVV